MSLPSAGSAHPSATAVGRPRATSAAKLGPDNTAIAASGRVSAKTSVIKAPVASSKPLAQTTSGVDPAGSAAATARVCWAGVTSRTASAAPVSARSDVALIVGDSGTPGRNIGLA